MNSEYKHYVIYQITNLVNGMIYIGQHSTNNLDDGYMGSGVYLNEDIKKYGIENFKKEILFECSSREELSQKEAELVNDEFINRPDTYNLVKGGGYILTHGQALKSGKLGQIIHRKKYQEDAEYRESIRKKLSESSKRLWREHPEIWIKFRCDWTGRHHSEETKEKMSEKAKLRTGQKSSAFGKVWIYNELVRKNISVKPDMLPQYLDQCWAIGRVMNWDNYFQKKQRTEKRIQQKIERRKFKKTGNINKSIVKSIDEQINYYKSILPIFLNNRWKRFVELSGYKYSSQNWYQQLKTILNLDRPTLKKMKKESKLKI